MIRFLLVPTTALLLCGAGLAGCTGVQPWERGILAKPHMALERYPLPEKFTGHNHGSREAAAGTGSAGGGGCGCY
jgi:hypothetical protein